MDTEEHQDNPYYKSLKFIIYICQTFLCTAQLCIDSQQKQREPTSKCFFSVSKFTFAILSSYDGTYSVQVVGRIDTVQAREGTTVCVRLWFVISSLSFVIKTWPLLIGPLLQSINSMQCIPTLFLSRLLFKMPTKFNIQDDAPFFSQAKFQTLLFCYRTSCTPLLSILTKMSLIVTPAPTDLHTPIILVTYHHTITVVHFYAISMP